MGEGKIEEDKQKDDNEKEAKVDDQIDSKVVDLEDKEGNKDEEPIEDRGSENHD